LHFFKLRLMALNHFVYGEIDLRCWVSEIVDHHVKEYLGALQLFPKPVVLFLQMLVAGQAFSFEGPLPLNEPLALEIAARAMFLLLVGRQLRRAVIADEGAVRLIDVLLLLHKFVHV
jgi:hypothetical protein